MNKRGKFPRFFAIAIIVFAFLLVCVVLMPGCQNSDNKKDNDGPAPEEPGVVTGTVYDKEGNVVYNATIEFEYTDDPPSPTPSASASPSASPSKGLVSERVSTGRAAYTVTSDDEGNYFIVGPTVGRQGILIAYKNNLIIGAINVVVQETTNANINYSGLVTGVITSNTTPLSGVTVSMGTNRTTTNSSGNYTLGGVSFGQQTIRATKAGYAVYSDDITVYEEEITYKDINLGSGPQPTPTGTSTASPHPTGTSTASPHPTPSGTSTASPHPTPSGTATASPSPSPSATSSPTPSPTWSPTTLSYTFVTKYRRSSGGAGEDMIPTDLAGNNTLVGTNSNIDELFNLPFDMSDEMDPVVAPSRCNGVTIDAGNNLYACASDKNVYKYNAANPWEGPPDLTFVTTQIPRDITAAFSTNRVYVLTGNSTQYYMESFNSATGASTGGWGPFQNYNDSKSISGNVSVGTLYISFRESNKVVEFDITTGTVRYELNVNKPYGIYVNNVNRLYVNYIVSGTQNYRGIDVYDMDHNLIGRHICAQGVGNNQLSFPMGIYSDNFGNLYIADFSDKAIVKFNVNQ